MAGFQEYDARTMGFVAISIVQADGTTSKVIRTATNLGERITACIATSLCAGDHVLNLAVYPPASADSFIAQINVPAGAGHGAVPAVDCLAALLAMLPAGFLLPSGYAFKVKAETSVGAAPEAIHVNAWYLTF